MKLYFELLHCGVQATFCRQDNCLRQEYVVTSGHYRLKKSYYGHDKRLIRAIEPGTATLEEMTAVPAVRLQPAYN